MNASTGLAISGLAAITAAGVQTAVASRLTVDLTQLFTFLAVVAGFVYQGYRESRQRRWDLQDRKAARDAADTKALALSEAIEENTRISVATATQTETIVKKTDEAISKTDTLVEKTAEIQTQTNGNHTKLTNELRIANEKILGLEKLTSARLKGSSHE
jgi:hypothetical protein